MELTLILKMRISGSSVYLLWSTLIEQFSVDMNAPFEFEK